MIRRLLEAFALFLTPFVLYAALLAVRQRYPWLAASWTGKALAGLGAAGLALVLAAMLLVGTTADRHQGAYQPAHLENGRLVPGQIR